MWNSAQCYVAAWVGREFGGESVSQFSRSVVSNSLLPHGLQQARPPCPAPISGVYSNSCPLSQWCHPTISSSVVPFSSHLQSFPTSLSAIRVVSSASEVIWHLYLSSEVIDISPSNLNSSLSFIQPGISHDVQRSNCQHLLDHWKSKKVPEKHLFLLYWPCQSLWLCGSQ